MITIKYSWLSLKKIESQINFNHLYRPMRRVCLNKRCTWSQDINHYNQENFTNFARNKHFLEFELIVTYFLFSCLIVHVLSEQLFLEIPASHCPEVDIRWTHDEGNVQIRLWSSRHRAISGHSWGHLKPSYDRRSIFQAPAATSWAVAKSLACQKIARRPYEGSFSCGIRVSMLPFARLSWGHLVKSCHLRLYFVWSSVPSGIYCLTKTIRRKQEAARLSSEGNTTTWSSRNAIV